MPKISSRSVKVPTNIRDLIPFKTHGALCSESVSGLGPFDSGRLRGKDEDAFRADMANIDYVVYSYATPIAWHTPKGWYKVEQKFSVTTSKHQGTLYMI